MGKVIKKLAILSLVLTFSLPIFARDVVSERPEGRFISISKVNPNIIVEMRYFGHHNFVGRPIPGYHANKCILTVEAAEALSKVQVDLEKQGYSLKVYDCYRPVKAVLSFVEWVHTPEDTLMKKEFYPRFSKSKLIELGYIASRSSHSKGSAVDLTAVKLPVPDQPEYVPGMALSECFLPYEKRFKDNSIDMGAGFDCFDTISHTLTGKIGKAQLENRLLLKSAMEKHGYRNYRKEWWHFTLRNQPFPSTRFDFDIN